MLVLMMHDKLNIIIINNKMIKSLHLRNFRSFPNYETIINFTEGINLIDGVNGSGKSTIMNALMWGIWGRCNYKKSDITNVSTNGECWVKVVLRLSDGTDMSIERTMKSLEIKYDGEKLSFSSIAAANAFIVKKIGMRYNIASFLMAFSGESCITSMTPAKRREIVEIVMGLDIIKIVNDKTKQYMNSSRNNLDTMTALINNYQNSILNIKNVINNDHGDNDDEILEINNTIEALRIEYTENLTKQKDSINDINNIRSQLTKLGNEASVLNSKKNDLISRANMIKSMNVCPTCCQTVTDTIKQIIIDKYRQEYIDVNSQWNISKGSYDELLSKETEATNTYNLITSKLSQINNDVSELRIKLASIEKNNSIVKASAETISKIESDIADVKHNLEEETKKYNIMSTIYEKTKKDAECILQVVGTHLDIISKHASNIIGTTISFNPDYTITATDRNMDISILSSGEQKKIDFAIKLALLDTFMTSSSEVDVCFIDESLAAVDVYAICDIVKLLRKYTHHRHIGMYIVHHAQIDDTLFDSVIHVSKASGYSKIDVTRNYIAQ